MFPAGHGKGTRPRREADSRTRATAASDATSDGAVDDKNKHLFFDEAVIVVAGGAGGDGEAWTKQAKAKKEGADFVSVGRAGQFFEPATFEERKPNRQERIKLHDEIRSLSHLAHDEVSRAIELEIELEPSTNESSLSESEAAKKRQDQEFHWREANAAKQELQLKSGDARGWPEKKRTCGGAGVGWLFPSRLVGSAVEPPNPNPEISTGPS